MRRLALVVVLVGVLVAGAQSASGAASGAASSPLTSSTPTTATTASGTTFTQPCGGTSWWAGSTNICHGHLVYRDYVYDDEGADTGDLGYGSGTQNAFGTLAHPAGDKRYPANDTNSADLVRLEMTRSGPSVQVLAELGALRTARSTVLAVAVDTDGNPATGGGAWKDLGVRSGGWDALYTFPVGDPQSNTIRGTFPLPKAASWRVQAVTAQATSHTVMNVAFRGVNEKASYNLAYTNASPYPPSGRGAWFEDDQAAALKSGDISRFGQTVRTADLQPGVTRTQRIGPGLHSRVYTSKYTLPPGEGMSYSGIPGRGGGGSASAFAQVFNFLGRYQPYGVYVPHTTGPFGLQMEWHGSNQGLVAQINQPGMQGRFGEELDRVLVVPEARGPNGYGSDISERDLLDVMADARATFPIDGSRVFSSGYSQGGYLAFRMAMLYPDRFAGFTSWVGFTGNDSNGTPAQGTVDITAGAVGNMIDYVGNLRHVPGSMLYGGADELVQVPSSTAIERAFAATDDVYTWYMHPAADHLTLAAVDDWRKEAAYSAGQRLVPNPSRVTFRTAPLVDSPQYGIRHDRAYWVSGITGRQPGFRDTDLASAGCAGAVPSFTTGQAAGPDPVPWTSKFRSVVGQQQRPRTPQLTGTVRNVATETVDARRTCLTGPFSYRIVSDGPTTIRLSDGRTIALKQGVNTGTR